MKAVVSGSTGFLGRNLVARLNELGYVVVPIPRDTLYRFESLQKFFLKEKPDVIFHLAAYGNQGRTRGQINPQEITAANVGCTLNMLEASLAVDYKAFINFGSSSEYGEKEEAMSETDLPTTDTFYGASKLAGTYLARSFAKQYNKPIVTVRPFSVYGDYEGEWRFIPTVIRSILLQKEFPLEEEATHDWIYVKDFVNAVIAVTKQKNLSGEWINIGTGRAYSNIEIVEMCETLLDKKALFKSVTGLRPGHSIYWKADNRKLAEFFKCSYDITDGLVNTIKFYKKKYIGKI